MIIFVNINLCQTKSLILKQVLSRTMFQRLGQKNVKLSESKDNGEKEQLEQSNPFKINIKQINMDNPFQMNLGVTNKSGGILFAHQNSFNEEDNFEKILEQQKTKHNFGQLLEEPKLIKSESKLQSTHSEQNIKKYKDTLRVFYNKKYWQKAKNIEDSVKKIKKESSGPAISQEIRKPETCFKANRLPFNKENKTKINSFQKLEQYYLIGFQRANEQITIYQLKHPNIKQLKPLVVKITPGQKMGSSIQYDPSSGRVFLFSNDTQQIIVLSTKAKEVICRIKLRYERTNPSLHINKYKNNIYLLVIGGYRILNNSIVEGCKFVQIFNIDKWEISLKQVILRLGIGRISPIVFTSDQVSEQAIFIIGGSSLASINKKKEIFFNIDQDINISTNKTAVKIDLSFIEECFINDYETNTLLANNINVQFENPLQLYGGVVLFRKLPKSQKLQLFLPNKRQLYVIRTLKSDVHIIESELISEYVLNAQHEGVMSRSIGYHRGEDNVSQLYRVDEWGKLVMVNVSINQRRLRGKQQQRQCNLI